MKTKVFSAWTDLVEKFLKDISSDNVSYNELSNWMDKEGSHQFQIAQTEFFTKHKKEFSQEGNPYPPLVPMQQAYDQIEFGFDQVFRELLKTFPSLMKNAEQHFILFKKEALGEKYLPLIATRAVITNQMVRNNITDPLKGLNFVRDAYDFLSYASKASIETMNDFRPQLSMPSFRGPASPFFTRKFKTRPAEFSVNLMQTHDRFYPKVNR